MRLLKRLIHGGPSTNGQSPDHTIAPTLPPADDRNPYLRGRAEFDSVFSDLAKGKRNWQLAAFGAIALAGVLAAGVVMLATHSRITPYVVEVDRLGRAQAFGPAERLRATDERVIISQLATFVRDIRSVVADPAAQADLVRRAYAFVDQGAAPFLNAYFTSPANDPRILGREMSRLVEVTSVLPVPGSAAGSATWKVSWTETSLPLTTGGSPTVTAWEGYFTTRTIPPETTDRITINPLGLYVASINWTQLAGHTDVRPGGGTSPEAPLSAHTGVTQ